MPWRAFVARSRPFSAEPTLGDIDAAKQLVLDNYGTHKAPAVQRWFTWHPRFAVHFTPASASWLNQVERFFAEITRRRIRRGSFTSVPDLERAIRQYLEHHNTMAEPFVWTAATFDLEPPF